MKNIDVTCTKLPENPVTGGTSSYSIKYCPHCGAENKIYCWGIAGSDDYCVVCGKQI